jgi:rhodanese-related sulfurtransferase
MKKITFVSFLFLAFIATGALAAEQLAPDQILKNRIAQANANINSIDSVTLKKWIDDGDKDFLLLDVREPDEISAGKIVADESMAIPRGLVEMQFIRKVKDLNSPVVVYCLKGSRGALTADTLKSMGYSNVYNLKGGLLGWIADGHPVSNFFGEFKLENFDSNFDRKS